MSNQNKEDWDSSTHSNCPIWFLEPERTLIQLEDLKYATSRICRYNGHHEWMLVQHLALCTLLAAHHTLRMPEDRQDELIAQCAAHDLHEAYVGDVSSNLKKYIPQYKVIEDRWEIYVLNYFQLNKFPGGVKDFIKFIDLRALTLEMLYHNCSGAQRSIDKNGRPHQHDFLIYEQVEKLSLDECWEIVIQAIEKHKENIWLKQKNQNSVTLQA